MLWNASFVYKFVGWISFGDAHCKVSLRDYGIAPPIKSCPDLAFSPEQSRSLEESIRKVVIAKEHSDCSNLQSIINRKS